jgi:hypothetical protein
MIDDRRIHIAGPLPNRRCLKDPHCWSPKFADQALNSAEFVDQVPERWTLKFPTEPRTTDPGGSQSSSIYPTARTRECLCSRIATVRLRCEAVCTQILLRQRIRYMCYSLSFSCVVGGCEVQRAHPQLTCPTGAGRCADWA